jgi:predicted ATP-binding protein involved in virulence
MTYWHLQMYKRIEKGIEKELFTEHGIVLFIEEHTGEEQRNQFKKEMDIGDIVLIKRGATSIALVEVIGDCQKISKGEIDSEKFYTYKYKRKIKVLDYADKNMKKFPQPQRNLQKSSGKSTPTYQYIHNWYTQTLQKNYNKEELIEGTYKLKELYIKNNQKTFQEFKIDFTSDGKNPLPIIVIAGKNGTGKTTLLKYLANFEIQEDDYLEIFKVDNQLKVNNLKVVDGMKGIQSTKKEYSEHIEYLPVYSSKVKDVKDFILNKHRKRSRELDSIKKATKEIGDFIENIFYGMDLSFSLVDVDDTERDEEKIIFKNKNGKEFDIDELSTGEKTLLSKVLYLYFKDVKNQIILIDEPELSLHPTWQNRVLKLYENFAKENNCQIIIATHSPHIIGSAKNEWIRILTEDGVIDNFSKSYGLEFSKILTDIMGVDNLRTPDVEKDFKFIKKEIYSNNYRDNPRFEKVWKHLEENLESNDIDLDALRHDFEMMKKMTSSYENIEKEEFQEAWDRLEKNLGKSDLDLKLLRLEMKFRDK